MDDSDAGNAVAAVKRTPARIRVVRWNQDKAAIFSPVVGSELYWLWTRDDKAAYPSCRIKGDVRVVMLTKAAKDEDEYEITFRCGTKRNVSDDVLRLGCDTHNEFVNNSTNTMMLQRAVALREPKNSAYCVSSEEKHPPLVGNHASTMLQDTATICHVALGNDQDNDHEKASQEQKEDVEVQTRSNLTVKDLEQLMKEAKAKEKAAKKLLLEGDNLKRKRVTEAKAAWKEAMQAAKIQKRKGATLTHKYAEPCTVANEEDTDANSDGASGLVSDDEVEDGQYRRSKLSRVQKWINGNRDMRKRKDMYIARATVDTLPEGLKMLKKYGIAIVNNMVGLFSEANKPDKAQQEYILNVPQSEKQIVFEGVEISDVSSSVTPHFDKDHVAARRQLRDIKKDTYKDFKLKYAGQQEDIIKGMFEGMAGCSSHWKLNWNVLVGGVNHQHPHTDTASRAGSYEGLDIFPFVALHGFGLDPFALWLLPDPLHSMYGFMHTFESHQILFMRGDVVHAGVPSPIPRGHMEFFPTPHAGWRVRPAYWLRKDYQQTAFPWQHPTYPFGYPYVGQANDEGTQIMTYPTDVTHYLQCPLNDVPQTAAMRKKEIRKRKHMKQTMVFQLGTY